MLSTRLLTSASTRVGRLAAAVAQRSIGIMRGANTTTCLCSRIASIRTLDTFPSTSSTGWTKRKYTSTRFQCMPESDNAPIAEPTRLYKVMSPNQHAGQSYESSGASPVEVHHAANAADVIISTPSSEYEDYDLDNLEMPISATTSMDYEDNTGCDSLDMDDVLSVREARRVWDAEHGNDDQGAEIDDGGAEWYLDEIGEEIGGAGGEDLVEMEEDWEVLHEEVVHASDGGGDAQAEEDGDVVIDW